MTYKSTIINDLNEHIATNFNKFDKQLEKELDEKITIENSVILNVNPDSKVVTDYLLNNNFSVSFKNANQASLSFSENRVNTQIGYSTNITFGDSYNIRSAESKPNPPTDSALGKSKHKYDSRNACDNVSFTIGNSSSYTGSTDQNVNKKSVFTSAESFSVQEGKHKKTYSTSLVDASVYVVTQSTSYEKYDNRKSINAYVGYISTNIGLTQFSMRRWRFSTYLINFNTNCYLASSRIVHKFLTVMALNKTFSSKTKKLFNDNWGMTRVYARFYSNTKSMKSGTNTMQRCYGGSVSLVQCKFSISCVGISKKNEETVV